MGNRKISCIICASTNLFLAVSTSINKNKFTLCCECLKHIQSLNQNNIYDHSYDEFIQELKGTRSVIINTEFGGFLLSSDAKKEYLKRSQIEYTIISRGDRNSDLVYGPLIVVDGDPIWEDKLSRDDLTLVSVVQDLGELANGVNCKLKIVKIPADIDWVIEDYDGREYVVERHRFWG